MAFIARVARRTLQARSFSTSLPYRNDFDNANSSAPSPPPSSPWVVGNGRNYNSVYFERLNDPQSRISVPKLWLRDNCRCSQCVNPETMQRSFNVLEHTDVEPVHFVTNPSGLGVTWYDTRSGRHESFYEWDFLERYLRRGTRRTRPAPNYRWHLWGSEIADNPPTVDYDQVMARDSSPGLAKLMDAIARYGLVFVDNTPFDDAIHTKRLLERVGPIRETHYGGFYDFVPDMAKADTAYTNIALAPHTDTTYFTDPAGLQAFHLLSHTAPTNASEGSEPLGGQSLLIDGYRAAQQFRAENPWGFKTLQNYEVPWHASGNEGITITPGRLYPVFDVSDDLNEHMVIRWNNDDRGVPPIDTVYNWFKWAAEWNRVLKRPELQYWFQLKPGRTLIFDNHRVLHGRSAFVGLRRICGGYINRDDWVSRWRNLTLSKKEIREQVVG